MDLQNNIKILHSKFDAIIGKIKHGGAPGTSAAGHKNKLSSLAIFKPFFKILGHFCYNKEKILGLEISPHYLRVCQMEHSYGKWILNQLASSCMENQFTNMDIALNQDLYVENLRELLSKHKIKTTDVALSIPTSASIIKIINMPDMDEEDLAQAANMGAIWESMVNLSGRIGEYSVYYQTLQRKIKPSNSLATKDAPAFQSASLDNLLVSAEPAAFSGPEISTFSGPEISSFNGPEIAAEIPSAPQIEEHIVQIDSQLETEITALPEPEPIAQAEEDANSMDVLFVATKLADTQFYTDIAIRAGLRPIIVDAKCNALKHAFETNPEKHHVTHPYALLEFGSDENYIFIIEENKVAAFSIVIADENKQLLSRNVENPDEIQGFIQDYAAQLQAIIDSYLAGRDGTKIYNIYVSSNTPLHVDSATSEPLINIFIKQISEILVSSKISLCSFCNHIEVPAEFSKKVNAEGNLSSWAAVLGLATYRLDIFNYKSLLTGIERVNLLPGYAAIIKDRVRTILSTISMVAMFALAMLISAGSFLMLSAYSHSLASQIKSLEYVKGEFAGKTSELQKLSIVMDKVKSLDKVRTTLPSNQVQILNIYKNITKSIPEGVWLSDVAFTQGQGVEIKGKSINDQNILEFVNKLNDSGAFKKVALKTMEVQENKEKTPNAPAASTSQVKKFSLVGEITTESGAQKLELISGGAK